MDRAEIKLKLPLMVGAIPFLLAGIDGIAQGLPVFGGLNLAVALINLIAMRFVMRRPRATNVTLFVANAVIAGLVTWDYFQQGKQGLPYAWTAITIGYLIAAAVSYRRVGPGAAAD